MRLLLSLIFSSIISNVFGQKTNFESTNKPVCILPSNCLTITNDKPIKPFNKSGKYLGKVIIQAELDTTTMKLVKHKIIYADLHSKLDPTKQIEVRLNEDSGETKYLDTILPELINHLKYLKFKISRLNNCIMTTSWKFPIIIK